MFWASPHFLSGMLIVPKAQITNSFVDGPGPLTKTSSQANVQDAFVRQQAKNAFDSIKDDGILTDFKPAIYSTPNWTGSFPTI